MSQHRAPSQNDRVLAALRRVGERGISPLDFLPPVIDGGAPITRLSARVDVLRNRGYAIPNVAKKNEVARYVLAPDEPLPPPVHRLPAQPGTTTIEGVLPS